MKKYLVLVISLFISVFIHLSPAHAAENSPSNIYVAKAGDTLPEIAKKYRISVEELKVTNGLQSNLLLAGQKLWVPNLYEVVAGDTLKDISSAFHSSVETIKVTNGLSTEQVNMGQLLMITPKKMTMQGQHILMTREEFRDWLFHNQFNRKITLIQQHHT